MKYDYKAPPVVLEILLCIDEKGQLGTYFCNSDRQSSFIPPQPEEPPVIYHYCNTEVAFKIINTKTIWLSDLFQTNDSKEVIWFLEQFSTYANSLSLNNLERQKITYLYWIFRLNLMWGFAACFTSLEDDINQWVKYGDNGQGIALGIYSKDLHITRNLPERHAEGECQERALALIQVDYDEQAQLSLIKEIINEALYNHLDLSSAGLALAKIAYTCKKQCWHSEQEWRILYTPFQQYNPYPNKSKSLISPINNLTQTKKYAAFHLSPNMFAEIILGPKCPLSIQDVMQRLPKDYVYEIMRSQTSLR